MGAFTMPSLGADMDAGTVTRWLVAPGDAVHRGDVVAVVDTEKSEIEVEVFEDGVVEELVVPEGVEVPVGTVLATIAAGGRDQSGGGGTPAPETAAVPVPPPPAPAPPPPGPGAPGVTAGVAIGAGEGADRVHSPVVRRLAADLGVDLGSVAGTGPGGTVTRSDVEAAARLAPPATSAPPAPPAPASPPVPARAPVPVAPAPHAGPARARSSPYARRLAAGAGVHVGALVGSGPGGAVVAEDVIAALASGGAAPQAPASPAGPAAPPAGPAAPVAPAAPSTESTSREDRAARLRRAIGNLMSRSKREIPHYYLATTVDLSSARTWLDEVNASRPVTDRLVMGTLLLAAAARAVAAVPEVNGSYQDGVFTPSPSVHLGVAISLRTGGVLAPAIHDADTKSVDELMAALSDLVKRARGGVLRGTELADATLTVTNLGDLGVDEVQGVIFPPQVALVGYGRVSERPMVAGGQVVARTAVTVTLAADHRVSDGHRGGRYLAEIDRLLQRPEDL